MRLPALFPLCALAAVGWEILEKKSAVFRPLLRVGLLAWAITVYSAFWIRAGNPFTHTVRGVGLADDKRYAEAAENFPGRSGWTRILCPLALVWRRPGAVWAEHDEARQQAELALQQHPDEAEAHIEMAVMPGT